MTNKSTNGEQRNLWAPSCVVSQAIAGQFRMAFARAVAFSRHVEMIVHDLKWSQYAAQEGITDLSSFSRLKANHARVGNNGSLLALPLP
jgi:hypothetical protein